MVTNRKVFLKTILGINFCFQMCLVVVNHQKSYQTVFHFYLSFFIDNLFHIMAKKYFGTTYQFFSVFHFKVKFDL